MKTETLHKVNNIEFDNGVMLLHIDGQVLRLPLEKISSKLLNASNEQRAAYRISPSGYGIHWDALDEDLAIEGLLKFKK